MNSIKPNVIAHVREADGRIQSLEEHLCETATLCSMFSSTIGMPLCGELLGLLHDIGKYSQAFQDYIRNVTGLNGEEAKSSGLEKRGKIDHATSGAQHIWEAYLAKHIPLALAQILSDVIMSHHSRSGLIDFIDLKGASPFLERVKKDDRLTYKAESIRNCDKSILSKIEHLLKSEELTLEYRSAMKLIGGSTLDPIPQHNFVAHLTRFLFSCLLDADRISTIDFENPKASVHRTIGRTPDWKKFLTKFESYISEFELDSEINRIRSNISEECRVAATRPDKLFTLQVPTGGGKTLASMRFALHRAASSETHQVERIIYVLPYTSIIDQNAEELRKIFDENIVLEHHSNLVPEKDTWRNRTLSGNWDAPIVFTTSVQFLNSLFAAGTNSARRMHSLSNAIVIFDEIQSLPIKTIHLFNNAIQFLCGQANTTAVLCTATMPLLQKVEVSLGALSFEERNGIISDKLSLFKELKRTEIIDNCRPDGWSNFEVRDLALKLQSQHQSLLIICNTKDSAKTLFELLKKCADISVVHLSTNMCPAHRKAKIGKLREALNPEKSRPIICISTQLIEAGVDLDFGCVIRSLAGLDSIVQAAGRCNRHGYRKIGLVHIFNFREEKLHAALKEIAEAQRITLRIFDEFKKNPESFDHNLLSEKAMNQFYLYFFHQRAQEMTYPCKAGKGKPPVAQNCSLLSLLSLNSESITEAQRTGNAAAEQLLLKQAHSTAAQAFQVIDAPTRGIIVPYDKDGHHGSRLIADLAASYTNDNVTLATQIRLHKQAQQYTVNAFPHVIEKLTKSEALREIQSGEGIYYLDERHYHEDFGVTLEALSEQNFLNL